MIYTAVIVVCLAAAPTDCRTYEQPLHGLSPIHAMAYVQAQALIARWLDSHPRFVLQAFTLEPGRGA